MQKWVITVKLIIVNVVVIKEQRLYWINIDGDMKSAKADGSDVKTINSTNVHQNYHAISANGSYIYYANHGSLMIVNKTRGSTPTVLYSDTSEIGSLYVFNLPGMWITMYIIHYVEISDLHLLIQGGKFIISYDNITYNGDVWSCVC